MCLAMPGKIIKISGDEAVIDYSGEQRTANTSLLDVKEGDYVVINAGFVIEKIPTEQALKSIQEWENARKKDGNI